MIFGGLKVSEMETKFLFYSTLSLYNLAIVPLCNFVIFGRTCACIKQFLRRSGKLYGDWYR